MSQTIVNSNIYYGEGVVGLVRKAQEDSHDMAVTPNGDVYVVCDGMGGHVGGAKASSLAVSSILEHLKKEKYASPIDALNGALQYANMQILGFANDYPEYRGMGTTACIVMIQDNDVWIAHVGDSRIYLYLGKEKQLHRITKDHSFVQTLVDAGEITDEEAEHHPNKNRILKALGIRPELQPTFNYQQMPIHAKNGDIFLICSDGLSGMISDKTISKVLAQNIPLDEKGSLLVKLAMQGEIVQPGGQDNCTLELVQIGNSPWKKSVFKSYNPVGASVATQYGSRGSKPSFFRSWKFVVLLIAVLALVGLGCWYLVNKSKEKEHKAQLEKLRKDYDNAEKAFEDASETYVADSLALEKATKDTVEFNKRWADSYRVNPNREKIRQAANNLEKSRKAYKDAENKLICSRDKMEATKEIMDKAKAALEEFNNPKGKTTQTKAPESKQKKNTSNDEQGEVILVGKDDTHVSEPTKTKGTPTAVPAKKKEQTGEKAKKKEKDGTEPGNVGKQEKEHDAVLTDKKKTGTKAQDPNTNDLKLAAPNPGDTKSTEQKTNNKDGN